MYTPYAAPERSAIPRVIGIIAIVFAVIGFGSSVLFTFGPLHDLGRWGTERLGRHGDVIIAWLYLWGVLSFVLFLLHLLGGVFSVGYRPLGLKLLTAYAVGALVLVVVDVVVMLALISGRRYVDAVMIPRILFAVFATPWPIVVLALVNTRRAKAACS